VKLREGTLKNPEREDRRGKFEGGEGIEETQEKESVSLALSLRLIVRTFCPSLEVTLFPSHTSTSSTDL
jgi:hypothetical protein